VRDGSTCRPQIAYDLQAFFKQTLIIVEVDAEGLVLAAVVAAAGGEIDTTSTEEIQRGPLLGYANGMVKG
jgi:hypothetical protein